jgi:hypothetical protein
MTVICRPRWHTAGPNLATSNENIAKFAARDWRITFRLDVKVGGPQAFCLFVLFSFMYDIII